MPAVSRLGDLSTGHGGWPARPSTSASPNVFVNGIAVNRVGDTWATHDNDGDDHDGTTSSGSGTVLVNGLKVARIGDAISCGDKIATGSGNVFAN